MELTAFRYDWVHVYLQDGVLSHEIPLLFDATSVEVDDICSAVDNWTFCCAERTKLKPVMRIFHRNSVEKLKANLSETLSCYGFVRHFIETFMVGKDPSVHPVQSYQHLCRCIDCILQRKFCMDSDRKATQEKLLHHTEQFMLHHVNAYGKKNLKPKHHWMFDVAEMLDWDKYMVDGFTVERLHLRAKFLLELSLIHI